MTLLILATVFLGTVGLLVGAYLFINRRQLAASDSARARLVVTGDERRVQASILKGTSTSSLPFVDRLLSGRGLVDQLTVSMQQAGVVATPGKFVLWALTSAALGVLLGSMMGGGLMLVFTVPLGLAAPFLWLSWRQKKRLSAFQAQLPDAIDMLVNAMRAGYSFQAAMRFIGEEVTAPLGPEFSRFYDEQRLGMDVRTALLGLQDRVDSLDLKMFITAVLLQRETGGNLSEVLANIAGLMRERVAIKGDIETLTAESKLSARILSALPVLVFVVVKIMNPDFMAPMLARTGGKIALVVAAVLVVAGYFSMMKIADIDI